MDSGTRSEERSAEPGRAAARRRLRQWGGDELLQQLTSSFVAQVPDMLQLARHGIERSRPHDVERAAHVLRSSAAQLGAVHVETACARMERLAAVRDLAACEPLIPVVEDEVDRYVDWARRDAS